MPKKEKITITVQGKIIRPYRSPKVLATSLFLGLVFAALFTSVFTVFADPPASPYTPQETLTPTCSYGDTNCTTVPPISAITGTNLDNLFSGTGILVRTGPATYTVNNYLTANQSITLSGDLSGSGATSISGTVTGLQGKALPSLVTGLLKYNGSAWVFDTNTYLTQVSAANLDNVFSSNGLLERTGANTYATATPGTDYVVPSATTLSSLTNIGSSLSGLLKASSGSLSGAVSGTDYVAPGVTTLSSLTSIGSSLSGLLKASSGSLTGAVAGTDYAPATSGSGILKGNGSGGFAAASAGTDYVVPSVSSLSSLAAVGNLTSGSIGTGFVVKGVTMTLGSDATGDIYYRNGSGVLTRLGVGADGTMLTINSSTHLPAWQAAPTLSPGGSDTQLQYNNAGSFAGISGLTTNGTAVTVASGDLILAGSGSGTTTLNASASASGSLTLPAATDTLVGRATTDTLTNKTLTSSTDTLGGVTMSLGSDATGDTYYRSGGVLTRLAVGSNGNVLEVSGGVPAWGPLTAAGAGSDTQVQYNAASALAGAANMVWNNISKLLSLTGTAALDIQSSVTPPAVGANLVAHYEMNDNAANTTVIDSEGSNNGTATNNTSTLTTTGKINGALLFNGTNQYVSIPHSSVFDLGTGDFTISAWIYPTSSTGSIAIGDGTFNGSHFSGIQLQVQVPNVFFTGASSGSPVQGGHTITVNTWNYITITRQSGVTTVYVNGIAGSPSSSDSGSVTTGNALDIGRSVDNSIPNYFAGRIDDVRVYNAALSAGVISAIYNSGNGTESQSMGGTFTYDNLFQGSTLQTGNTTYTLPVNYPSINPGLVLTSTTSGVMSWGSSSSTWSPAGGNMISSTAGNGSITGTGNFLAINGAGAALTSGSNNNFIGYQAGGAITTSSNNNLFGYQAGYNQSSGTYPTGSGLIAHYELNDNAANTTVVDSSASGNNGTATTNTANMVSAKINGALSFNGSSDFITLGSSALTSGATTISMWINKAAAPANTFVGDLLVGGGGLILNLPSDGSIHMGFRGFPELIASSASLTTGAWYNIVYVYSGGSKSSAASYAIYLNGVSQTLIGGGTNGATTFVSVLGAANGGSSGPFPGSMDDVRIYNTALSSGTVSSIYNSGSGTESESGALGSGLVDHYEMNDNAANTTVVDDVGGINGTAATNTANLSTTPKINGAFTFNGSSTGVLIPNQDRNTVTVSAWVKRARTLSSDNDRIVMTTTFGGWALYFNNNKIAFGRAGASEVDSSSSITDTLWHHIVVTYDGATAKFYIDGSLDNSVPYVTTFNNSAQQYEIGAGLSGFFQGLIDDVRIYNTALNSTQISQIYNSGNGTEGTLSFDSTLQPAGNNNAFGYQAGYTGAGNNDNFLGYQSGYSNTAGHDNNFLGYQTGYSNTTGYNNNFLGSSAGYSNTTGFDNNFSGYQAGYSNTSGSENNFFGTSAGYSNTTGHDNNFLGSQTGFTNTTGYNNNFLGNQAGSNTNLVAHYKMNDNASNSTVIDSIGSNNGTAQQNTSVLTAIGKINGALSFNGTSDYINLGSPAALALPTFTISAWIKPSSLPSGSNYYLIYGLSGDPKLYITPSGTLDLYPQYPANTVLTPNVWTHVAVTSNGSTCTYYVNGVTDGTVSCGSWSTTPRQVKIGQDPDGSSQDFPGLIDDVRVYGTALSSFNISAIYNSGSGTENQSFGSASTGHDNNFLGNQSGFSITSAADNNFLGSQSGYSITTGSENNFIGYQSGYNSTTAANNNFIGYQSGYSNTTGANNDFIGYQAGLANTTGSENEFLGYQAGYNNNGSGNIFIGPAAGYSQTSDSNTLIVSNEPGAGSGGDITSGLLRWYKFDDGSGSNPVDSASGDTGGFGITPTWIPGWVGPYAVQLNGNNLMNASATGLPMGSAPRTLTAWVKTNSGGYSIFGYGTAGSYGTGSGEAFGIANAYPNLGFYADSRGSFQGTKTIDDNQWHFVAITYDGTTVRLYVDGVTDASRVESLNTVSSGSLYVAYFPSSGYGDLAGDLDDARIYNRALSNNDIATLYNTTNPITESQSSLLTGTFGTPTNNVGTNTQTLTINAGSIALPYMPAGGGSVNVQIDPSTGILYQQVSSEAFKTNIQPLQDNWDALLQADPKSYNYKSNGEASIGFLAQDFDTLGLKDLVTYEKGEPYAINYDLIPVYLTEIAKQQQTDIDSLKLLAGLSTDGTVGDGSVANANGNSLVQLAGTILGSLGITLHDGLASVQNLAVDSWTTKIPHITNGIQLTDQATGQPYCAWFSNGQWEKSPGTCDTVLAALVPLSDTTTPSDPDDQIQQVSQSLNQTTDSVNQTAGNVDQVVQSQNQPAQQAQQAADAAQQAAADSQSSLIQTTSSSQTASIPDLAPETSPSQPSSDQNTVAVIIQSAAASVANGFIQFFQHVFGLVFGSIKIHF